VRVLAASDALAVTMLGHIHAQDALLGPLLYLHATFLGPAPGHVEDAVLALEPVYISLFIFIFGLIQIL